MKAIDTLNPSNIDAQREATLHRATMIAIEIDSKCIMVGTLKESLEDIRSKRGNRDHMNREGSRCLHLIDMLHRKRIWEILIIDHRNLIDHQKWVTLIRELMKWVTLTLDHRKWDIHILTLSHKRWDIKILTINHRKWDIHIIPINHKR